MGWFNALSKVYVRITSRYRYTKYTISDDLTSPAVAWFSRYTSVERYTVEARARATTHQEDIDPLLIINTAFTFHHTSQQTSTGSLTRQKQVDGDQGLLRQIYRSSVHLHAHFLKDQGKRGVLDVMLAFV